MMELNLKAILKRTIIYYEQEEYDKETLGKIVSERLTDYCPVYNQWSYKDDSLMIKVGHEEQDKLINFVEDLVDCSYTSDYNEDNDRLILSFTLSTLIDKLKDVNLEGYVPLKMDRFRKITKESRNGKSVVIVDSKKLVDDTLDRCNYTDGAIFCADTGSEWVNNSIVDDILLRLNTDLFYTKMLDSVRKG